MIAQPIIDRHFRNRIPICNQEENPGTRLVQHPKFTELGPLRMDRMKTFTDVMAGEVLEAEGVC